MLPKALVSVVSKGSIQGKAVLVPGNVKGLPSCDSRLWQAPRGSLVLSKRVELYINTIVSSSLEG